MPLIGGWLCHPDSLTATLTLTPAPQLEHERAVASLGWRQKGQTYPVQAGLSLREWRATTTPARRGRHHSPAHNVGPGSNRNILSGPSA